LPQFHEVNAGTMFQIRPNKEAFQPVKYSLHVLDMPNHS
jgi:hypothetical protein